MKTLGSKISISTPSDFDLSRAVCSYGYFLLAPNHWDPAVNSLSRPFHSQDGRIIRTRITQARGKQSLVIHCDSRLSRDEAAQLRSQVTRMLRVNEDYRAWFKLHPVARQARFARLFRSPTLFEDVIKTITGCNVTWPNTMRMNTLLCQHIGQGAFPSPQQLADTAPDTLKQLCKVGYRAERIVRFARQVVQGQLDLDWFENPAHPTDAIYRKFLEIYGIGDFAASNLCQLVSRFDRLAIDSETYRHFRQHHGITTDQNPKKLHAQIQAHYAQFAPYQFIAYWFELWQAYEARFSDARTWTTQSHGPNFTANALK